MSARRIAIVVVLLAVAAGGGWFAWKSRRAPAVSDVQQVAAAPPRVPLAATIAAIVPEPGAPVVVSVRVFNHIARQAAATNAALEAAAAPEPRRAVDAVTVTLAPDAWASAVRFSTSREAEPVPATAVRVVRRPEASSHVLGDGQVVQVIFEISGEAAAALGGKLMATVSLGEWSVESNVVTLAAPEDAEARLRQRARAAEATGDYAALRAAGDALVAADAAAAPWGYWYRGLALEAQGDGAAALAAYQAAASRLPPASEMPEPPVDLFRRIAALQR